MTLALLLAALAVLPADRLAMADRLFNKGDYAAAAVEYKALVGEPSIAADELSYRLAECARLTGRADEAARHYAALVRDAPDSQHAGAARLQLALAATGDARERALAALDTDRVAPSVRAAALYHLGAEKNDAEILRRCVQAEPKGRYVPYADLRRGTLLTNAADAATRRKGVEILLGIAFGKSALADEALFLAASVSYREKKFGEAGSLFRRFRKMFPDGAHAAEARTLSVWCDYMEGRYADAAAACGAGETDDLAYVKACCAAQTGDDAAARVLFRKYLDDFPKGRYRADADLQLARLEFTAAVRANEPAQIVEAARRAAAAGTAADALRLAWAYEKAGRADEADAEYARIVRTHAQTDEAAQALQARAMAAARAGDWAKAELLLAEALATGRLGERKASALYWRGVAAMRLGHEAEAAGFLAEALTLGLGLDESREARLMLAEHDLKNGRTDAAKAAYARLVKEGACARMSAARIHAVGELLGGEAAAICAKALVAEKTPDWRQAGWAMQGRCDEARGAYSAAIDAYRQALAEPAQTESAASAALALGRLESRAGEHAAAKATLEKAVTLNAAHPAARGAAYLALAENARAAGDGKAARGYATVVTTLFADPALVAAAEKILKSLPSEK